MQESQATMSAIDRDALVLRHLPLVRRVARLHAGRLPVGVELDDLVSWGTFGLLAAVDRYERARDAGFAAYARFRIRGAILDQLRQYEWTPRSVREKAAAVGRAARDAERRLGRPATAGEIAAALGLRPAQYHALLDEIAPVALIALDEVAPDLPSWRGAGDRGEPLDVLLATERTQLVAAAIRRLPQREQLVLSLYYQDDLTMREVGEVLGVTESRVSQLHTQALLRVRSLLEQPAAGHRGTERGARLKVGSRTTDEANGGAWERTTNEPPRNGRGAGSVSRKSGSSSEAAVILSTRMPRRAPSSMRCVVEPAGQIEPAREPARRIEPDSAGG